MTTKAKRWLRRSQRSVWMVLQMLQIGSRDAASPSIAPVIAWTRSPAHSQASPHTDVSQSPHLVPLWSPVRITDIYFMISLFYYSAAAFICSMKQRMSRREVSACAKGRQLKDAAHEYAEFYVFDTLALQPTPLEGKHLRGKEKLSDLSQLLIIYWW